MEIPHTAVILAAAGEGRRLGHRRPKAFVPLAGSPLFLHSVRIFASLSFVRRIVIVLPEEWIARTLRAHGKSLLGLKVKVLVPGGDRRQDSVRNGLAACPTPLVLVHDAARPLVTARAVRDVARAAARHGAAVLAAPAVDTIKIADAWGRVLSTPDRAGVWHAQTPQGFRREVLEAAYRSQDGSDATDDAQLVERAGGRVVIVPSRDENLKVTTPSDLLRAQKVLDSR